MSAKNTNYSWSKFCWDDWRNDAALQSCDLATKGLWMDLLSLMFSSERQGYLQINHQPMSSLYLSKKTGVDKRTIEKKLKVLIDHNVCSVDEDGIIFSRRMAKENATIPHVSSKDTVSLQEGSRKVPVNLQQKNAEDSQKQDPLNKRRIEKNRIDISNKLDIPPKDIKTPQKKYKQGSRLPRDWSPDEKGRDYARDRGLDVIRTIEDFCEYWHAKAGKDATKLDWSLTWNRWCRKAKDWGNVHQFPKKNQQNTSTKSSNLDWMIDEQKQQWGGV